MYAKTGAVITVEEAQKNGGLGGAVAELLAENFPTPMRRMGVGDEYGQSGTASELLEHYGLTTKHIMLEVHSLLSAVGKM